MPFTSQSLRSWLAAGLQYSGANSTALALRFRRDCVTVLCYHRVLDSADAQYRECEPGMATSAEAFEKQMELVARHFNPIPLSRMVQWLDGEASLPGRAALVTFDDGWSDTYTNAFPIMSRLAIPGVVFLSTGFIGTSMRYWTDRIYDILQPSLGSKRTTEELRRLKRLPFRERRGEIREIEYASRVKRPSGASNNLTWGQVKDMAAQGFEFGSHTRNHVILPNEVGPYVLKEMSASADDIRFHLDYQPLGLAYPDGQFDEATMRLATVARYKCAFTCREGLCTRRSPRHALPRICIHDGAVTRPDGDFSPAMFLTLLAGTIPWRRR